LIASIAGHALLLVGILGLAGQCLSPSAPGLRSLPALLTFLLGLAVPLSVWALAVFSEHLAFITPVSLSALFALALWESRSGGSARLQALHDRVAEAERQLAADPGNEAARAWKEEALKLISDLEPPKRPRAAWEPLLLAGGLVVGWWEPAFGIQVAAIAAFLWGLHRL